ncbi:aromatic amino acid transport family protein [Peribacillus butanolivorans]|uniref:aromatic amino acid transport family protein n=1 Tax=Peribacillus butanolivorans TaxID=421767 RepID=UPI0035D5CDE1
MAELSISMEKDDFEDPKKWHKHDTVWVLGIFGTAIGAGVLFLPINAGIGGIWTLLIVTVLAFPITYYAHRALARFVLSGTSADDGITGVVGEHFGSKARKVFMSIHFFVIYITLLLYAVSLTNTVQSFIVHQMHLSEPPRALVALVLILGLMFIVRFGQDVIIRVMGLLVYPFIGSLIFMGLYLIPKWNRAIFDVSAGAGGHGVFMTIWMIFPVLALSFNHYAIISPFVVTQRKRYGDKAADAKCSQIQRYCYIFMVGTVLFFVYSCVLSLSPADLALAKDQNITVLSYLANHFQTPLIAYLSPIIAFVAITKSFLGHYIGAYEALRDIIIETVRVRGNRIKKKKVDIIIFFFFLLTSWYIAYVNPNILGIIESIIGPIGAIMVLLLPMYAIRKLPILAKYRRKVSNVFVTVIGLVTVSAIFFMFL